MKVFVTKEAIPLYNQLLSENPLELLSTIREIRNYKYEESFRYIHEDISVIYSSLRVAIVYHHLILKTPFVMIDTVKSWQNYMKDPVKATMYDRLTSVIRRDYDCNRNLTEVDLDLN